MRIKTTEVMSSQLVVVDLTKRKEVNFSELTRESLDSIMLSVFEDHELGFIHQYAYNLEYSNRDKMEVVIYWDKIHQGPKPDDYVPAENEQYVTDVCKRYEKVLDGKMTVVTHFGMMTRVEFSKAENKPSPLTLDWLK